MTSTGKENAACDFQNGVAEYAQHELYTDHPLIQQKMLFVLELPQRGT